MLISGAAKYLNCILSEHRSVTIIGDFNMVDIKWASSAESQQLDVIQRKFYQFCSSWDLQEIVQKPTQKQNHFDFILTTRPERYGEVYVKLSLLNSDHDTVILSNQLSVIAQLGMRGTSLRLTIMQ